MANPRAYRGTHPSVDLLPRAPPGARLSRYGFTHNLLAGASWRKLPGARFPPGARPVRRGFRLVVRPRGGDRAVYVAQRILDGRRAQLRDAAGRHLRGAVSPFLDGKRLDQASDIKGPRRTSGRIVDHSAMAALELLVNTSVRAKPAKAASPAPPFNHYRRPKQEALAQARLLLGAPPCRPAQRPLRGRRPGGDTSASSPTWGGPTAQWRPRDRGRAQRHREAATAPTYLPDKPRHYATKAKKRAGRPHRGDQISRRTSSAP